MGVLGSIANRVDSELLQKRKEKGLCNSASNHPKEMISQMMKPYKLHKPNKNCLLGNWRVRELEVNVLLLKRCRVKVYFVCVILSWPCNLRMTLLTPTPKCC